MGPETLVVGYTDRTDLFDPCLLALVQGIESIWSRHIIPEPIKAPKCPELAVAITAYSICPEELEARLWHIAYNAGFDEGEIEIAVFDLVA